MVLLADEKFQRIFELTLKHCKDERADIIIRHVVKLKAADKYVPEKILKEIDGNYMDFRIQCEREIGKRKNDNSEVPFWKILISNHSLANLARNEETVQFFASQKCGMKYPIYSRVLRNQMKRGVWRKMLLDKVKYFFEALGEAEGNKHLPKLPKLCIDKIFSYLSNRDFRNLIIICNPFEDFDLDICNVPIY